MNRKTKRDLAVNILIYAILLLMIVVAVFPAIWMISTSIKDVTELFDMPPEIIPDHPTFGNYLKVLGNSKMFRAFFNSAFITACVVLLTLFFSVLAGYGLARYQFKGHGLMKVALLFGQMVPGVVIIIPLYSVFTKLGLLDTHFSMIVADMALTIPMGVIMLSSFFEGVPKELEEAAKIDGCNSVKTLWYVIVPMLKPSLVSCALFQFMWTSNDFMGPLIYISDMPKYTNSIYLRMSMDGDVGFQWNRILAMSLISIIPSLIVFFCAQDSFIDGIAAGGVKG